MGGRGPSLEKVGLDPSPIRGGGATVPTHLRPWPYSPPFMVFTVTSILPGRGPRNPLALLALLAALGWQGTASAQDLEPRRWTHLPVGMNVAGLTYVYTDGDLAFDPVLQITNAKVQMNTGVSSYTRALNVFGKSGRLDVIVPYQSAHWEGKLSGDPESVRRRGFSDPWVRFSVDLRGAPALQGKEYQQYRAAHQTNTIVGAALGIMLPLGEYQEDKLLNLGQNRFIFRPQAGVVHSRGPWAYELTGSVFLFTKNDDFFGGNERKQDPLFAFQTHVIRTFKNQWWASASAGYSWGGESEINGESKDDDRSLLLSSVALGFPIGKTQSLKLFYLRGDKQSDTGSDTGNLGVSWSIRF